MMNLSPLVCHSRFRGNDNGDDPAQNHHGLTVTPAYIIVLRGAAMNSSPQPGYQAEKSAVWKRGGLMFLLYIAFGFGQGLLFLAAAGQFFWLLFKGEPNSFLISFGKSHSLWLAANARYLTCATEEKPFPWAEWPKAD
jgi:hypothetical protein